MAAFNRVTFDAMCPCCGMVSLIKAQFHIASSFEGDNRGRFCNRNYRLNDEIIWWTESDIKWSKWSEGGNQNDEWVNTIQECCYAECTNCGAGLYAVIEFCPVKPIAIIQIGSEDNWPLNFNK